MKTLMEKISKLTLAASCFLASAALYSADEEGAHRSFEEISEINGKILVGIKKIYAEDGLLSYKFYFLGDDPEKFINENKFDDKHPNKKEAEINPELIFASISETKKPSYFSNLSSYLDQGRAELFSLDGMSEIEETQMVYDGQYFRTSFECKDSESFNIAQNQSYTVIPNLFTLYPDFITKHLDPFRFALYKGNEGDAIVKLASEYDLIWEPSTKGNYGSVKNRVDYKNAGSKLYSYLEDKHVMNISLKGEDESFYKRLYTIDLSSEKLPLQRMTRKEFLSLTLFFLTIQRKNSRHSEYRRLMMMLSEDSIEDFEDFEIVVES